MNEWVIGWVKRWMDRWVGGWMRQTGVHVYPCIALHGCMRKETASFLHFCLQAGTHAAPLKRHVHQTPPYNFLRGKKIRNLGEKKSLYRTDRLLR